MKASIFELVNRPDRSLTLAREILQQGKDSGVLRQEAYAQLESVRELLDDEDAEDFVLEIMDVVSNWCLQGEEIWQESSQ